MQCWRNSFIFQVSWPRQFGKSNHHPSICISDPVTLGRKYDFVVISDLHFILFEKHSVDSLSLLWMVLCLQFKTSIFLTPRQKITWGIARKITNISISQSFYLKSSRFSKRYRNTPILFSSHRRLRSGAVLNSAIRLSVRMCFLYQIASWLQARCVPQLHAYFLLTLW